MIETLLIISGLIVAALYLWAKLSGPDKLNQYPHAFIHMMAILGMGCAAVFVISLIVWIWRLV